jgi:hypothetical protein
MAVVSEARIDHLANLLGRAAIHVWGDIPRDVQEALFETAMKGRTAGREALPACSTTGIRKPSIPPGQGKGTALRTAGLCKPQAPLRAKV